MRYCSTSVSYLLVVCSNASNLNTCLPGCLSVIIVCQVLPKHVVVMVHYRCQYALQQS